MVQVKLSKEILSIRGRFGGVYFKTGRPGQHIQAMPRHIHRLARGRELGFRDDFTSAAAIWAFALLAVFWSAWKVWALANMFTDRNGESKRISGYNWYIHYALTFPETQALPFWKPPHAIGERPDYYVVYKGLWTYSNAPEGWPDESPSDYYWESPIPWNGQPAYRTDDIDWHIWWKDPKWVVSPAPGFEPAGKTYYSDAGDINDHYVNPVTNSIIRVYIGTRR